MRKGEKEERISVTKSEVWQEMERWQMEGYESFGALWKEMEKRYLGNRRICDQ